MTRSKWLNGVFQQRSLRRKARVRAQKRARFIEALEVRTMLAANPIGTQFLANETIGLEESPAAVAVTEGAGNGFVATWTSYGQAGGDTSGLGVYAQRFLMDGSPNGAAFLVNSGFTDGDQDAPDVAIDAAGNFVIVWESPDQDGDGFGIYGQRYLADGTADGTAFKVNEVTAGDQENPTIVRDDAGRFVIAWQSEGQDGDGFGIYARRYAADGMAVDAEEFLVNTITDGNQKAPTAAVARDNGNFVIAWEGDVVAAEESVEILAHVYDSDGVTIRGEFQVNTITPRDQVTPDVAMDASGDFIVAWTTEGQPGSGSDIQAQLFDATGATVGGEFRVNETTLQGQVNPSAGIDEDGDILLTWQSSHQDEFSWGIFGRVYDSTGAVLTTEFQVNTFAEQPQTNPGVGVNSEGNAVVIWQGLDDTHTPAVHAQRYQLPTSSVEFGSVGSEVVLNNYAVLEEASASVAVDANRNFVVVWQSDGDDGSGLGIVGRRFDPVGAPLGDAFVVNTTTMGNQSNPSVAMDAGGNFTVVWESADQDGDGHGIFAQQFDAVGNTLGSEFQVNTMTTGSQEKPAIAMDPNVGNFVAVWQGPDADLRGIYAQRFDATGSAVGGEFAVNSFTDLDQVSPAVSMNAAGQFVVGWVSDHRAIIDPEDSEKSIFVQWYDATGTPTGDEQLAHSIDPVAEAQEYPDVAIDGAGNFVAVWQSITQDGSAWGVYGRQFLADKTPVQPIEFLINQHTEENQRRATVAADPDGNFVVNWQSDLQDQAATAIISRQYNADGTPETDEALVNNWELGPQILPVTAMTPAGDFGVFWLGQGTSRKEGIHGRIYEEGYVPPPPHIFVEPAGAQFLVKEAAGLETSSPSVAVIESTGNYVAAWTSFEQPEGDESGLGVYVQRFLMDGTPNGDAVLVNTAVTDDDQDAPAVAVDAAGNFVVIWESLGQDGDGFGIFGQRYAADGTPQDGVFQVNTVTANDQENPSVAMDNAGNFVVAWQSLGQDGDGYGVYARRYDTTGAALDASEVLVNDMTDGNQVAPAVARARDGSQFIVAWQADVLTVVEEEVETEVEVYARLFDADGTTLVGEFQVNTIADKDQVIPDVAMSADGDFVVAWTSEGQVGSGADVFARRFNSAGVGQADDFRVNVTTGQGQQNPAVAIDGDGDFIISWESSHQDGFSWGIFAQVYDAAGNVLIDEFQVNSNTQGPQIRPDVSANSDGDAVVVWLGLDAVHHPAVHAQRYTLPQPGEDFSVGPEGEIVLSNYVALEEAPAAVAVDADRNFVAVWQSYGEDGSGLGIFGRRLDPLGNPLGDSFLATTTTDGNQSHPDVAADAAGNFTVVWQSAMQDGNGYGVFGRQFAFDGSALGGEFQVNTTTAGQQGVPSIAMDPDEGTFVVVWQGPDADELGIFGQRYNRDGTVLGSEFQVNSFTDLDQVSPSVSMNAAGQFVVVWVSDHRAVFDPTDTEKTIFAQWYDSDGTSVGDEVAVHSIQPEFEAQEYPDVAITPDGGFAVAFQSVNQDGNTWGVFARQFLADKTPVQPIEFQVNQTVLAPQRSPSIVSDEAGNFVIAWQAHKQDSSGPAVFARVFDAAAVAQTDEFLVPTWDQGPQTLPVMAMTPNGEFGVFWTGHGVDRVEGVHGRIYLQSPLSSKFDFGTTTSPVEADYQQVTPGTVYDASVGYGWTSGAIDARDRGAGTALTRDFNFTRQATFVADVINGDYAVTVLLGDMSYAHDNMGLVLEDVQVDSVTTARGEVVSRTYDVAVTDGQLTMGLMDLGGRDAYVVVAGLEYSRTQIVEDTQGPRVVAATPSGTVTGSVDRLRLTFDKAIDAKTFSPGDVVELTGPAGSINPVKVDEVSPTVFEVTFAPQTQLGEYQFVVGPHIRDAAGNLMNQDGDAINGETPSDQFVGTFTIKDVEKFDFGTATSPVEADYQQVKPGTVYNASVGYGWMSGAIDARDREAGTALTRDFNFARQAVFVTDVVNGDYAVTVLLGDMSYAHDNMGVFLEGVQVDSVTTARGEVVSRTYDVAVTDGQLTMGLMDLGGRDAYVVVAGLEYSRTQVAEDTEGPRVVAVTPSGTVNGAVDRIRLTFDEAIDAKTFSPGDVVELTGPAGPINPTQVDELSPTVFEVTFPAQTQLGEYQFTIGPTIKDIAGNLMNQDDDAINGETPSDQFVGTFTITDGEKFDFGTAKSPVETDYEQVTPGTIYNVSSGYGWTSAAIDARDREAGTALTRDFNFGRQATFVADVANGDYAVTVLLGDMRYAHDNMGVYLEGAQVDSVTTARGEIVSRTYDITVADGQLTLGLVDLGGRDVNFVVAGLEFSRTQLAEDTRGPRVVAATPSGTVTGSVDRIRLTFDEAIDAKTFGSGDVVELTGPAGPINPAKVEQVSPTVFDVTFAEQTQLGAYQLVVGSTIKDLAGNLMDQDGDLTGGEVPDDRYETAFVLGLKFDYGTSSSPVTATYRQVTQATTYNAALGYGWVDGAIASRDRVKGTALERDFNFTTAATFAVDLPNGQFQVTVTMGDVGSYSHDLMGVSLEGELVDTLSTASGQVLTRDYMVTVDDGQLTLRLQDLGGRDANVVINGLVIVPKTSAGAMAEGEAEEAAIVDAVAGGTVIVDTAIGGPETIDITGNGEDSLILDVDEVLSIPSANPTLRVRHDDGDKVNYGGGWQVEMPQVVDGQYIHVLSQDSATVQVVNTTPFSNPFLPMDVNRDGNISPLDALIIVNKLSTSGPGTLSTLSSVEGLDEFFYFDTNADRSVAPIDVIRVVNYLNDPGNRNEGQFAVPDLDLSFLETEGSAPFATAAHQTGDASDPRPASTAIAPPAELKHVTPERGESSASGPEGEELLAAIDTFFKDFGTP